jgi:HlyD family secretion protein
MIEAVNVVVAPELAGRVAEVYVEKGDQVSVGDLLFKMDDELLEAQREQILAELEAARANLITAEAGLDFANASLEAAEVNVEAAQAAAEVQVLPAEQALEELYENVEVARGEALKQVSAANRAVRDAQYQLDNFTVPINHQQFSAMEGVAVMKEALDKAREAFEPYKYLSSNNETRQDLKEDLEDAQSDFDSAVRRLEYETNLAKARANQDKAVQDLAVLQDGPDPDDIAILEAQIAAAKIAPKQAQAAAEQARVAVSQAMAMHEQAQAAVAQAEAALKGIDVQSERLAVIAAVDGSLLARNVQPGEVIQPGTTAMTIGELEDLTVTVYISQERYGQINLGDQAVLTADSFPGETFDAIVVRIADRAEFTPRNVQTQEDRRTIVFAVELAIDDQSGKLKPGMPADVEFMNE